MRNEERRKPPKRFEDDLQALLNEDDTQTQQELADQLNVSQKAKKNQNQQKNSGFIQKDRIAETPGAGVVLGFLAAKLFFPKKKWPTIIGSGIGMGWASENCEKEIRSCLSS